MAEEWGYIILGHERAEGTYASREEAIREATEACEPGTVIDVGLVEWADPAKNMRDLEDMLEDVDQCAHDNGFAFWDDPVFEVHGDANQAEQELRDWAARWLKPCCWTMPVTERVVLPLEASDG